MEIEKDAVEVAEKYADSCSPNDKRPTIGSTYYLEISLRSLWEAERNSFLAGVKWERERTNAIVKPLVEALEWYADKNNYKKTCIDENSDGQRISLVQYGKGSTAIIALENYKKQTGEGK